MVHDNGRGIMLADCLVCRCQNNTLLSTKTIIERRPARKVQNGAEIQRNYGLTEITLLKIIPSAISLKGTTLVVQFLPCDDVI